ncbi:hypothetical protein ScPMuIL_003930 [Solemya velum]
MESSLLQKVVYTTMLSGFGRRIILGKMNRKRNSIPTVYKHKKRICMGPNSVLEANDFPDDKELAVHAMTDTKAALLYLQKQFPMDKFELQIPPIILKHQIYSIVKNKTIVDKQINDLRLEGEIRVFKLGNNSGEFGIVFFDDYKRHVLQSMVEFSISRSITEKFMKNMLTNYNEVSVDKKTLMTDFDFKDEEITQLLRASVLTVRDVGSWWTAIPNAGIFMKSFLRGRKAVLTMIRKCKYREILQSELEQRKWPKIARLGLLYHIHDIIGAELVQCIQTSSGQLLRLKD